MTETTGTELTTLPEKSQIPALFNEEKGIEKLVERIEKDALAIHQDYTTDKGRKAARSLAAKVSRSKTLIDAVGKDMTEKWRAKTNAVNAKRKLATERLDELRDKIKKPADEFEAKEAERVQKHMKALDQFALDTLTAHDTSAELKAKIAMIEAVEIGPVWEEFEGDARQQKAEALTKYQNDLGIAEAREAQERELEQYRREAAEREASEAEERHQRELAEARAREEAAAKEERDRIAAEKRAEEEAAEKRKADAANRRRIRSEVVKAIAALKPENYEEIVDAMIAGEIPHVEVKF